MRKHSVFDLVYDILVFSVFCDQFELGDLVFQYFVSLNYPYTINPIGKNLCTFEYYHW